MTEEEVFHPGSIIVVSYCRAMGCQPRFQDILMKNTLVQGLDFWHGKNFKIVLSANFLIHSSFRRIAFFFRHTTEAGSIMAATASYVLCEFALYFAMEQTNLSDLCLRLKQTDILLNVWRGKDVTGI